MPIQVPDDSELEPAEVVASAWSDEIRRRVDEIEAGTAALDDWAIGRPSAHDSRLLVARPSRAKRATMRWMQALKAQVRNGHFVIDEGTRAQVDVAQQVHVELDDLGLEQRKAGEARLAGTADAALATFHLFDGGALRR